MAFLDDVKAKIFRKTACHMTHVDNLPAIFAEGALLSKNEIQKRAATFTDISFSEVQSRRKEKTVNGLDLHDYVPLYFGVKTPMVAVHNDKQEQIVFLQFELTILQTSGCVISDGNAASEATKFRVFSGMESFDFLDLKAIATTKYRHDPELRRKKQAEVLIPHRLPLQQLARILVFSASARQKVLAEAIKNAKRNPEVIVSSSYYFLQGSGGAK